MTRVLAIALARLSMLMTILVCEGYLKDARGVPHPGVLTALVAVGSFALGASFIVDARAK